MKKINLEKTPPILIYTCALVFLLVLGFGILQIRQQFKTRTYAGEIFGQKITSDAYNAVYRHLELFAKMTYGKMFEQIQNILDLDTKAWERLILMQEARKRKIKVSDQEVIDEIAEIEIFHNKNKFDTNLYRTIIQRSFQMEVRDFEEAIRENILAAKLRDAVTSEISITEQEVENEYKKQNEQIQFQYAVINTKDNESDINITDEEIKTYYQDHQADFTLTPAVKLQYVKLAFPAEGGVQKEVEMKFKARAIYDDHVSIPKLDVLAQKFGFEAKTTSFFGKNNLPFELGLNLNDLMKIFKLKKGELAEPVELEDGYLVYKVVDKKDTYTLPLTDVTEQIRKQLAAEKIKQRATLKAQEFLKKVRQIKDEQKEQFSFQETLKDLGFEVKDVPLTAKSDIVFMLGFQPNDQKAFFALNKKDSLAVISSSLQGPILLYVTDFKPINAETFRKQEKAFSENLIEKKKDEAFANFLDKLKEQAALTVY